MSLEDRIKDLERRVSELSRNVEGLPVRYAGGGGGGSDATIVGGFVWSEDAIDAATEITWADVPTDVKVLVPQYALIDNSARCLLLASVTGERRQVVAKLTEDNEVAEVYVVPVAGEEGDDAMTFFNSCGDVAGDKISQCKTFTASTGGATETISIIDATKCS